MLLLLLLAFAACPSSAQQLQITIPALGSVRGTLAANNNVRSFLGIPFAGTQTQANRFLPPLPLTPWSGVLQATSYKPKCIQTFGSDRGSEDCLYLNIHVPAEVSAPLPVMVWIHGGAFANGDGRLDGAQFVQNSNNAVIVVTIQYRLNAFGFLVTDSLRRQGRLNLGLLDQKAAFEWINQHIVAFGGDPSRITAFGESAGGTSVGMHLIAQSGTQKLFSRAILQSGSPTSSPRLDTYKFTDQVLQNSGCAASVDQVACLRGLSALTLSNLADAAINNNYAFGPYVDGTYINIEPGKALDVGAFSRVPILVGSNSNEGTVFVNKDVANGYTSWIQNKFQPLFGLSNTDANQITTYYPQANYPSVFAAAADVYGNYKYTCQVRNLADVYARSKVPVYKYRLDYQRGPNFTPGGNTPGLNYGAYHSLDVELLWSLNSLSQAEQSLGRAMIFFWVSFATIGQPGSGMINKPWSQYSPPIGTANGGGEQMYLNLPTSTGIRMEVENFIEDRCAFWGMVRGTSFDVSVLGYGIEEATGVLTGAVQVVNYSFTKRVIVRFFDSRGNGVGVPINARYTRAVTSNNRLEIWSFSGPAAGVSFTVTYEAVDTARTYIDDNGGARFPIAPRTTTATIATTTTTTITTFTGPADPTSISSITVPTDTPPTSTVPPLTTITTLLPTPPLTGNVNLISFAFQDSYLSGSVQVRNLCYNKRVQIVATLASGSTTNIVVSYSGPLNEDGSLEKWTFGAFGGVVSFYVSYNALDIGQTFIDNNEGKFYVTGLAPSPVTPTPAPLPIPTKNVQVVQFSYQNGVLGGQIGVRNIAFQKVVSVLYQDLNGVWSATNLVKANYRSAYPGATSTYELWNFGQPVASIRQFYVKYEVAGQTFFDNNNSVNFQV
ncbi:hypothetical protein HDU67_001451 [Dinochytrium kinnereticum]|nr:hypothetical protein HDU67_001451 [Dinochytrium kinnereticum]